MALEREALSHKIEDDLALRNRNWDKLDSLIADYTTVTSMELPLNEGIVVASVARITKVGKVVNLTVGVKKADGSVFTQEVMHTISQLPVGYRPPRSIVVPAGLGNAEWRIHHVGYVFIGSDGRISVMNSVNNTATVVYFNTSYIVN